MTERSTFDSFEGRLAEELTRYVAPAADPRSASEIADRAMRPRGLVVRARNVSRRRRSLLVGLAAVLVLPATYLAAGSVRPTVPDVAIPVQPSPVDGARPTSGPPGTPVPVATSAAYVPLFVRRVDGPEAGVSIFAVRPDGLEVLIRTLPDAILTVPGTWSAWGNASESGWIAMSVENSPGSWPLILVDLGDPTSTPWVIGDANVGGVGPRWGPNGLLAAPGPGGMGQNGLVIVEPDAQTARLLPMQGRGLIGGGPSIVWAGDGNGIVGVTGSGGYEIVPLDGGDPRPGVEDVFDPRGAWGPGLTSLGICSPGARCAGGDDGRVEQVAPDGSARTIWRQTGADRALGASIGSGADEFWLSLDHDAGRQITLVHVHDGREDTVATFNRDPSWQYVAAPIAAPDQSAALAWIDLGGKSGAVLAPLRGGPPTFHPGHFAGFVDTAASGITGIGQPTKPSQTMPAAGAAYALPPVEDLIAAELARNPGRQVLGQAARDGVEGQSEVRTFEVPLEETSPSAEVYLDCFGPSGVTVTAGLDSTTSPCLRSGAYSFTAQAYQPITVTASGDTSWRVVVYLP